MKPETRITGAKAGIPIAIRRGDLDLCKTCIDILWQEKQTQAWLKWSTLFFIAENVCYLLSDFNPQDEKDYRRVLAQACLLPKQRDPFAMSQIEFDHVDNSRAEIFPHEQQAIEILETRMETGGALAHKEILPFVIQIITERGIDKNRIQLLTKEGVTDWNRRCGKIRKPTSIPLPWYIFGPDTEIGETAFEVMQKIHPEFLAQNELSQDEFKTLWRVKETFAMTKNLYYHNPETNSIFENRYYDQYLDTVLQNGKSVKDYNTFWREEVKYKLEGCIRWVLGKQKRS